MSKLLPDFKKGPLDFYRQKASFDWRKLKIFLDGEEVIQYQNDLHNKIKNHEATYFPKGKEQLLSEQRRLTYRQTWITRSIDLLSSDHIIPNPRILQESILLLMQISPSSYIKYSLSYPVFRNAILAMGSDRQSSIIEDLEDGKILGCYALTEIAHGSNIKGMQTTATYDKEKGVFVLHSKDFQAAKCWVGGLGQGATHAVTYAQLITNNENYGFHSFVVPLRNPETMEPYPGVLIGDLGEKIGLNGIDNGFVMFNNYEIPHSSLLNKLGDVVPETGEYRARIKDPSKRQGAALGSLSAGRIGIVTICLAYGIKAISIALRYAAVRKQFGPDSDGEVAVLEYQTHQYRLIPYLAAIYVQKLFSTKIFVTNVEFTMENLMSSGENRDYLADFGMELHALSSAGKPVAGWLVRDAIQSSREACGGHGYLKAAGIGDLRNDHDGNLTYEGENYVLIQQTSNWLLKKWPLILKREKLSSPMKSIDFLSNGLDILNNLKVDVRSVDEICLPKNIISIYQWLVCFLMKKTADKIENNLQISKEHFWANSNSQVFHAKNLAVAFIEHYLLQTMLEKIAEATDPQIKNVLLKLFCLYGVWSLEKHIPALYEGQLITNPQFVTILEQGILNLCADLKDDVVGLVDVIAPPDYVLNSVLGASDGEVYKHLQRAVFNTFDGVNRTPSWWKEEDEWRKTKLKNKL